MGRTTKGRYTHLQLATKIEELVTEIAQETTGDPEAVLIRDWEIYIHDGGVELIVSATPLDKAGRRVTKRVWL